MMWGAGQLRASLVGAGNAAEEAVNAMTTRRTSRSMLLQEDVLAAHPQLAQPASLLQQRAKALLQPGELFSSGRAAAALTMYVQICPHAHSVSNCLQTAMVH